MFAAHGCPVTARHALLAARVLPCMGGARDCVCDSTGRLMDYTNLSTKDVYKALMHVAAKTRWMFGDLDVRQLNWRAEEGQWSVGQCFQHLLTANALVFEFADAALADPPATLWHRVRVWPTILGPVMIRSQAPGGVRKYKAPMKARPSMDDVTGDIITRFVDQQRERADKIVQLDEAVAQRVIMTSPFVRVITYSVLDGYRLVVAHDWRHVEQAMRVMSARDFPSRQNSLSRDKEW
jgi:hypothetical protein